ncbi:hypothetical protein JOB18_040757 [Solea senegalensis]|uniref:Uncharacterized protein n=1 Tax=Solea senegalensis TaxID=28829 RepID=A0AAV6T1F0_SOLSE|nr:hypothetical protein JOB18_040757 [Solea senegalensis]
MRPIVNPFLEMPHPTEQQQREPNQGKCCKALLAVFFIGIITTGVSVQWPGHQTSREHKDTEGRSGVGVSPMQDQEIPENMDKELTVTEKLVRKKRKLFEHTDWKPWNFNANELLDNSNKKNSWYSFIGWMKNKVYGSNTTVLIVQSPPANWHSLFQLEENEQCKWSHEQRKLFRAMRPYFSGQSRGSLIRAIEFGTSMNA